MVGVFRGLGNSPLSQERHVGPQIIVQGRPGCDTSEATTGLSPQPSFNFHTLTSS